MFNLNKIEDNNYCIEYLKSVRWKNGTECPFCSSHGIYEFKDGERFKCKDCEKIFSIKVGTPFENSRLPLSKWFKAIILLKQNKLSSAKLSKELEVSQRTAWYVASRLKGNNAFYLQKWV